MELKNVIDKILVKDGNSGFDTIYICVSDELFEEKFGFNADTCEKRIIELQKDLDYYIDFQNKIETKFGNEKFMLSAPIAIVQKERDKYNDNWAKIGELELMIMDLNISIIHSKNEINYLNS